MVCSLYIISEDVPYKWFTQFQIPEYYRSLFFNRVWWCDWAWVWSSLWSLLLLLIWIKTINILTLQYRFINNRGCLYALFIAIQWNRKSIEIKTWFMKGILVFYFSRSFKSIFLWLIFFKTLKHFAAIYKKSCQYFCIVLESILR